jgi:hypothetical protein
MRFKLSAFGLGKAEFSLTTKVRQWRSANTAFIIHFFRRQKCRTGFLGTQSSIRCISRETLHPIMREALRAVLSRVRAKRRKSSCGIPPWQRHCIRQTCFGRLTVIDSDLLPPWLGLFEPGSVRAGVGSYTMVLRRQKVRTRGCDCGNITQASELFYRKSFVWNPHK